MKNENHRTRWFRHGLNPISAIGWILLICGGLGLMAGSARGAIKMSHLPCWQGAVGRVPAGLGWADFDDNGWLDLAVATGVDATTNYNLVYFNYDGEVSTDPDWTSDDRRPSGQLYVGDFEGDGDDDLVVANLAYSTNQYPQVVYLNDGGLSTSPSWESPDGHAFVCTAGDPDGDGDLDVAFARGYWVTTISQTSVMYTNDGSGNFTTSPGWETDNEYYAVGIAMSDIDLDGDLDLALGIRNGGVRVFYNHNGVLETTPSWQSSLSFGGRMIAFGDVDHDGDQDLAVAPTGGRVVVFKNIGDSLETFPTWQAAAAGTEPSCVAWADADGDGDLDLAAGSWFGGAGVFENIDGNLTTEFAWVCPSTPGRIQQVAWCDFDEDALVDTSVTFTGDGSRKLFYLYNIPLHEISSLEIDGVPLAMNEYCYDRLAGWISLATPPSSGEVLTVYYTFSRDPDLAVSGSSRAALFENRNIINPDAKKILLLMDSQLGANYDIDDGTFNIMEHFDYYGWQVTTAALMSPVSRCSYSTSVGLRPQIPNYLIGDIPDVTAYDIVCLLPNASGSPNLMADPTTLAILNTAADEKVVVAAWCRAVRVLAAADLLDGLNVVGHADYQAEYEAAGATYLGNDHPPIIQGNIVTSVRSNFYRTATCEAIARALSPEISATGHTPASPTQLDSIIISCHISDFGFIDTTQVMVDTGTGYFALNLHDDGNHHDGAAHDSLYAVALPPVSDDTEIEYYIRVVEDTTRITVMDPADAPTTVYSLIVGYCSPRLYISEFMAANDGCCPDEFGDFDDWIEIYNAEDVGVYLGDAYLTDNLSETAKFQIGDVTIPARGFALFWADGETSEGIMHADFTLELSDEAVGLYDSDKHGNTVFDALSYPAQQSGKSYGRLSDSGDDWVYFPSPTPGQSNGTYICGDVNGDYNVNLLDIVYLINFKYKSGMAPVPYGSGDVNGDGTINLLDIVLSLIHI